MGKNLDVGRERRKGRDWGSRKAQMMAQLMDKLMAPLMELQML